MSREDRYTLDGLDSCIFSDVLLTLGTEGVATGLQAVTTRTPIIGKVVTVQLGPANGSVPGRHLGTAAVEYARRGNVIVVAGGREDTAGWGGLLTRAAIAAGIAGVVVDGAVRDVDESIDLGLPIYARTTTPRTARGRLIETSWNEPVVVAGVTVRPGDVAVADGTGVVFVPGEIADDVYRRAREMAEREQDMAAKVDAGEPISIVMSSAYEQLIPERKVQA